MLQNFNTNVKADGKEMSIASSYPVDIYVDVLGEENDGRGGRDRPCVIYNQMELNLAPLY